MSVTAEDVGESCLEERVRAKEMVDRLLRHISNVQEACVLLGKRLIERGEVNLAIRLMANGQIHDHSKWFGAEWDFLVGNGRANGELKLAAQHHSQSNSHHPEYWGGIELMPRVALAEMVCDLKARSAEFGTSLWEYVKEQAMPRYGIRPRGKVYRQIKEFIDLLLDKPFEKIPSDI